MNSSLEYYKVSFCVSFYGLFFGLILSLYCLILSIATLEFFPVHFLGIFFFQTFIFSLYRVLFSWGGSLVSSICVGHVFLSIQLLYVVWLGHLIHLHLRLLLIGIYSLPFFHTCVPPSFTFFLPVLKASPLASPAELVWSRYILGTSFVWEAPYLAFHFNWELCWIK